MKRSSNLLACGLLANILHIARFLAIYQLCLLVGKYCTYCQILRTQGHCRIVLYRKSGNPPYWSSPSLLNKNTHITFDEFTTPTTTRVLKTPLQREQICIDPLFFLSSVCRARLFRHRVESSQQPGRSPGKRACNYGPMSLDHLVVDSLRWQSVSVLVYAPFGCLREDYKKYKVMAPMNFIL